MRRNRGMGAILQLIGQEMFSKTFLHNSIVCKNFLKMHVFQFFRDICTCLHPAPLSYGEQNGEIYSIAGQRLRDVFQNIFVHDCR